MINPVIYSMDVVTIPEDKNNFITGCTAAIGDLDSIGVDMFYFKIATVSKLNEILNGNNALNIRSLILIKEYNYEIISNEVNRIIKECARENWKETAIAINKYLSWEYDEARYSQSYEEIRKHLFKNK